MSQFLIWSFDPLISENSSGLPIPSLTIDECELCIIWALGEKREKGDRSMYDFRTKEKYYLPQQVKSSMVTEIPVEKAGKREPYDSPFIYKTIKKLEKKDLVKILKDSTGDRMRKVVKLTFSGLSIYLRGSSDKNRFKNAINHHPNLVIFSNQWDAMYKQIGVNKCIEAFEKTTNNCVNLLKAKFRTRSPNLEFEGFLRNPFYTSPKERGIALERDIETSEYLKTKEALVLRNSYISYLAVHDIFKLSKESREQVKKLLPSLESEKELAYFEKGKTSQDSLFKGKRLADFLPKYTSIEYFFTGMFVETLLWHEKSAEKESHDFNVEIY
jgi:DNA-binding MarR family transcriptional regulator